ncbi:MAG: hypothetical protein JO227_21240, partial [Acetobacteraceae bacterium]|nr:hypothetical protein [Acetobacteraceae bacterium]
MKPASNAALSGALIIAGVIGGLGLVPAHAQRYVAVNGHFLPQAQIETLDQQTCASV